MDVCRLVILYATETGNALDAAERVGREAERRGCPTASHSIHDFHPTCLPQQDAAFVFVVSTAGQGDPPQSMKSFWKFLLQKNLGPNWLAGVRYAVFGLGDSGYQNYNFAAKKLHQRLSQLGATPIIEKGLGDDQHPSGYEGALDPWLSSLWSALLEQDSRFFPNGLEPDYNWADKPKLQIKYHDTKYLHSHISNGGATGTELDKILMMSPGKSLGGKSKAPDCLLKLIKNKPITRLNYERNVRHIELEAVSSAIKYAVGDIVEILPGQDPAAVDSFIQRCNLDPEALISVCPSDMKNHYNGLQVGASYAVKLRSFVELTMDVASASPRRYFFEVMSFYASAPHEKERLQYFASPEGRDDLYQYNQKERRTVLEVLDDFPSVQMPFEWLVQLVPPLKTRAFSISSSCTAHPNQVHLTVSVVNWTTPYKRKRKGLCSNWLAGLVPQQGIHIPAWFRKGTLPAPPPSLPLILVGPGTGCAPFHGFVEERCIQAKTCATAPVLFFFGCRNEENDYLYREFWSKHSQNLGVLSEEKGGGFYVAFSRDQPQKVYVQHLMRERSHQVWKLLREGAAVYIAGSSTKMPEGVFATFVEIISKESGVPREVAVRWLKEMEKGGKYHVEAWS
uniref:NADPH-dependent diflavin oxidoreductase 1 n=2 Tax=Kalanchoe fedtschenkoi TaxID=63787 RepID=A0A7N0T9N3_KALFE